MVAGNLIAAVAAAIVLAGYVHLQRQINTVRAETEAARIAAYNAGRAPNDPWRIVSEDYPVKSPLAEQALAVNASNDKDIEQPTKYGHFVPDPPVTP